MGNHSSMLGKLLGERYQIVQFLSAGDFGQSYIAEDMHQRGNPKSVVKHIKKGASPDPNWLRVTRRRFKSETEALRQLGGYGQIPQLLASFEEDQEFYLVQEFIQGHALTAELPISERWGKPWTESEVIQLLQQVLFILEFVHSQGFIHCDLKPDNLIRRTVDHRLFLIDFGAVQPIISDTYLPSHICTVPITSLGYVPPEQFIGQPQPSSDIYALSLMAIQALTGLEPWQLQADAGSNEVIWQQHAVVSTQLAAVLSDMVRYNVKDRYQSATEVIDALQQLDLATLREDEEIGRWGEWEIEGWEGWEVDNLPSEESSQESETIQSSELKIQLEEILTIQSAKELEIQSEEILTPEAEIPTADLEDESLAEIQQPVASPSKPSLLHNGIKLGLAVNSLVLIFGIHSLLYHFASEPGAKTLTAAQEQYQQGHLKAAIALATSIPAHNSAYSEAQAAVHKWQQDWQIAATQYQMAQQAFYQSRWSDVLDAASKTPPVSYWQQKIQPLRQQAQAIIEVQAQRLLQQAYDRASLRDFSGALKYLKQIPPHTAAGAKIHSKLVEYSHKQQIKANHLLQQAYNRAAVRDFSAALGYLNQIPHDTIAHAQAVVKIAEYTHKQLQSEQQSTPTVKPQLPQLSPNIVDKTATFESLHPGSHLREVNIG